MPGIDRRRDITGFGQIIGVHGNLADIANKNSWKETAADIRSDHFVTHCHLVPAVGELDQIDLSLVDEAEISGNDTGVLRSRHHGADIAVIINNRAHNGVIGADVSHNTHKAAVGNYVVVHLNAVVAAFINRKNVEPVVRIPRNDSGANFIVIVLGAEFQLLFQAFFLFPVGK